MTTFEDNGDRLGQQAPQTINEVVRWIEAHPLEPNAHLYHPIPFDGFEHLRSSSGNRNAHMRWKSIRRALAGIDLRGLRVLDVGANAGFFSYQFALEGAIVDALEPEPKYWKLGNEISRLVGANVTWIRKNMDWQFLQGRRYDVVLMLSVFQWITHGNEKLEEGKQLLKKISQIADYLVFELGCSHGYSAIRTSGLPQISSLVWIYNLLSSYTDYDNVYFLRLTFPHLTKFRNARALMFPRALFIASSSKVELTRAQTVVSRAIKLLARS